MSRKAGYTKLAQFMVDQRYEMFRKFRSLAARDLLYLQAELCHLEDEYSALSDADQNADGEHKLYNRNWRLLSTSEGRNAGGRQWEKALQIRSKLREYYSCLSQYSQILEMTPPRKADLAMLREWIARPDLGGGIAFSGKDLGVERKSVYDEMYITDLTMLRHRMGENDAFTNFLAGPIFDSFEKVWRQFKVPLPRDPESPVDERNLYRYSDSHVIGVIDFLGTVMSSVTPLLSIIILYFVQNMGARLGIVCACTLTFSASLALVTKARRVEIFAAAAAFASVQVVFIGSNNNLCANM